MPIILQCDHPDCDNSITVQMQSDCHLDIYGTGWWITSGTPTTVCACSTAHLTTRAREKTEA